MILDEKTATSERWGWPLLLREQLALLLFGQPDVGNEFKLRVPKRPVRYAQSLGGGVFMGYGAGIGMGCTIGAFFSAIPSPAVNGWVFGGVLAIGAWIGTLVIQRIE